MSAEWRVIVKSQDDPQSRWVVTQDKFFETKKEAKAFKDKYRRGWARATLYHYEPSWVVVE